MLGRRTPRPRFDQALAWLWPHRGLKRTARYFLKRIARIKGSPHAIAAGIASGAAVSFLPLPGLHFVLAGVLAFALRGSLIASAVGTVVGNPWTFPFIWVAGYRIGGWLGVGEGGAVQDVRPGEWLANLGADLWRGHFAEAAADSWPVLAPTLVGGGLLAVGVWFSLYGLGRTSVAAYQTQRRAKLAAGRARWRGAMPATPAAEESKV